MLELKHDLKLAKSRDEKARMNFVSGLRSYVLNDMANGMRAVWDAEGRARLPTRPAPWTEGRPPRCTRRSSRTRYFKFYSTLRVTAQDMVWQSVFPPLDRQRDGLKAKGGRAAPALASGFP